jgi:hypothetical protein
VHGDPECESLWTVIEAAPHFEIVRRSQNEFILNKIAIYVIASSWVIFHRFSYSLCNYNKVAFFLDDVFPIM